MDQLNEAQVLDQVRDQWMQIATLLIWKFAGRNPVTIAPEDFDSFNREFSPGRGVLFVNGADDVLRLSLVDEKSANELIGQDLSFGGRS